MASSYLIQKIVHDRTGDEFDLSFLTEARYVETLDLSGPRLMLQMHDPHNILTNDLGVREFDEITVTIADPSHGDETHQALGFTILSVPVTDNAVKISAMATRVWRLKELAVKARMFTRRAPASILSALSPGKVVSDSFPTMLDYHLLPSERPAHTLRQMARELGAAVFLNRGEMALLRLSDMAKTGLPADQTYAYNAPKAERRIVYYEKPSSSVVLSDRIDRQYLGWDIRSGVLRGNTNGKSAPVEWAAPHTVLALSGLGKYMAPAIDFICSGNGSIAPGLAVDLEWNTYRLDAPIDESLPSRIVVGTVVHHYRPQQYTCRVKGVVPV